MTRRQSDTSRIKLARDARSGATVTLDLSLPRAIFVTGKRGSGKTTTLHTIATHAAETGATVIAIDPIGALLTLVRATHSASEMPSQNPSPTTSSLRPLRAAPGNASPSVSAAPTVLSIPGDASPSVQPLLLNPSDLSTDAWLALFDLSISKPGGILLSRALRLYVEHGDRYTDPRKPGRPPNSYRRDYYFTSVLKHRLPVANVYRAHYVSQVLATDPLAMLPAWRNLPGYLFDPPFELPARASSENVTLHTINLNIIQANWKRARSQARLMHALIVTSILLKLAASALPGAALATYFLTANVPGTLALLASAAIARTFGAAAAHTSQDLAQIDLPRAAAEDIASAVERAGVQTLVFGHSHTPDRARFGHLTYINTGTWTNVIAPLSAVAPPTRTYAHVDDDGTAHLLQWTDRGPIDPIVIRRR